MAEKSKIISGKRKTAIAKLKISPGIGNVFFNYLPHTELNLFHKLALLEPIRI
jgi:ribosomal protein S9